MKKITWEMGPSVAYPWEKIAPIRLGPVPATLATPDLYITVGIDDASPIRIDLYADSREVHHTQEIFAWMGCLMIGYGHRLYRVCLEDRSWTCIELGGYFSQTHRVDEDLLVATENKLLKLDSHGTVVWETQPLAIDGVVIKGICGDWISCEGDWDPPGGWVTYAVHRITGSVSPGHVGR